MSNPTPSAHALRTPELLELILSFLPPHALLLAQRTCKTWHTLITTSPTLQTALFFRAAPSSFTSPSSYTLNPLLTAAFPFFFAPTTATPAKQHPDWDLTWGDVALPATLGHGVKPFVYSAFNRRPAAFRRADASWRRMLLSAPAVQTVVWRRDTANMSGRVISECVVGFGGEAEGRGGGISLGNPEEDMRLDREEGVRMGLVYDYLWYEVCTGYMPSCWDVRFRVGEYPGMEEVVECAERGGDLSLTRLMGEGKGEGRGVTMLVKVEFAAGCVVEEGEDVEHPQFRSEGYRAMEVGPMATVMDKMWD